MKDFLNFKVVILSSEENPSAYFNSLFWYDHDLYLQEVKPGEYIVLKSRIGKIRG